MEALISHFSDITDHRLNIQYLNNILYCNHALFAIEMWYAYVSTYDIMNMPNIPIGIRCFEFPEMSCLWITDIEHLPWCCLEYCFQFSVFSLGLTTIDSYAI